MVTLTEFIVTSAFLTLASFFDLKTNKIPNWITFPSIIGGIVFSVFFHQDWLWQIGFVIGAFFFGMTGLLGLGDIKLLMALYAWNNITSASQAFLAASILVIIAGEILSRGNSRRGIQLAHTIYLTRSMPQDKSGIAIPFAPFLFVGYNLVLRGVTLVWS